MPRDITEVMVEKLALISSVASSPTLSTEPIEKWLFKTMLVSASVIVVAIVGIGLLLYFKKRRR